MAKRRKAIAPQDPISVLSERMERLERQVKSLRQAATSTVQSTDTYYHPDPVQGETVLHAPKLTQLELDDEVAGIVQRRQVNLRHFHDGRWRSFGDLVIPLSLPIEPPIAGPNAAFWPISRDLDGAKLQRVEAGWLVAGAGATVIDVNVNGVSMLVDECTIDSGDLHSEDSLSPVGISATNNEVFWKDQITVDIDSTGTGEGLTLILGFA